MAQSPQLSSDLLTIEETLTILEECLNHSNHGSQQHIQTLKTFYSPLFDFDYSESGSFFYAGVKSLYHHTIERSSTDIIFSASFKHSMVSLEKISLLILDRQKNQSALTNELLQLASVWQLNQTLDVPDLIQQALCKMRYDVMQTNSPA